MLPKTISATQEALDAGKMTTVDLVRQYLEAIEEHRHLNIYVDVLAKRL
jgi:aspartyl-tRNA(Asn)/glutamyl-tRNA(Gln) amidotransferase subunit A